jgi:hypothetical protein
MSQAPRPITPDEQSRANVEFGLEQTYDMMRALNESDDPDKDAKLRRLFEYESELRAYQPPPPEPDPELSMTAEEPEAAPIRDWFASGPGPIEALKPMFGSARGTATGLFETVAGVGQLGVIGAAAMRVPGADVQGYNTGVNQFADQIRGMKWEDAPMSVKIPELTMRFGADSLLAVEATPAWALKAGGFWLNMRNAAVQGGEAAALYFDDSLDVADKVGSTALGALAGVSLMGLVHGIPAAFQTGRRKLVEHLAANADSVQAAAANRLKGMYTSLKDGLTFAQETGSRAIGNWQASQAGNWALRQYRTQTEALRGELAAFGERYGPTFNPVEQAGTIVERGPAAIRAATSELAGLRRTEFNSMMDSAETAITAARISGEGVAGSEQVMFDATRMAGELTDLVTELHIDKTMLTAPMQTLIAQLGVFKGQLPMETLVATLRKLNANEFNVLTGVTPEATQHAFSGKFKRMLFDSIDEAPDGTSDALTWIKRARQSWHERSMQYDSLRSSVAAKALGLDSAAADPVAALQAIRGSSLAEQGRLRGILEENDPDLLLQIKGQLWRDSMENATSLRRSVNEGSFDPVAFSEDILKQIGPDAGGVGGSPFQQLEDVAGLWSRSEVAQIRKGLEDVRAIVYHRTISGGTVSEQEMAMVGGGVIGNVQSSLPFTMRMLYKLISNDKLLFTPEGRALIQRAYETRGEPGFNAAFAAMMAETKQDWLGERPHR